MVRNINKHLTKIKQNPKEHSFLQLARIQCGSRRTWMELAEYMSAEGHDILKPMKIEQVLTMKRILETDPVIQLDMLLVSSKIDVILKKEVMQILLSHFPVFVLETPDNSIWIINADHSLFLLSIATILMRKCTLSKILDGEDPDIYFPDEICESKLSDSSEIEFPEIMFATGDTERRGRLGFWEKEPELIDFMKEKLLTRFCAANRQRNSSTALNQGQSYMLQELRDEIATRFPSLDTAVKRTLSYYMASPNKGRKDANKYKAFIDVRKGTI